MTTSAPALLRPRPTGTWVATGTLTAGVLVATAITDDGFVLCPYRRCTGGWCPGCGGTRAAHRLLTGDLAGAWRQHPWVVLAAAQVLALAVVLASLPTERIGAVARRGRIPLLVANTVALLAIWAVRLTTGAVPTWWRRRRPGKPAGGRSPEV